MATIGAERADLNFEDGQPQSGFTMADALRESGEHAYAPLVERNEHFFPNSIREFTSIGILNTIAYYWNFVDMQRYFEGTPPKYNHNHELLSPAIKSEMPLANAALIGQDILMLMQGHAQEASSRWGSRRTFSHGIDEANVEKRYAMHKSNKIRSLMHDGDIRRQKFGHEQLRQVCNQANVRPYSEYHPTSDQDTYKDAEIFPGSTMALRAGALLMEITQARVMEGFPSVPRPYARSEREAYVLAHAKETILSLSPSATFAYIDGHYADMTQTERNDLVMLIGVYCNILPQLESGQRDALLYSLMPGYAIQVVSRMAEQYPLGHVMRAPLPFSNRKDAVRGFNIAPITRKKHL